MQQALAVLTSALCSCTDARRVLKVIEQSYSGMQEAGATTPALDDLLTAMALSASSAALKQHPDDPGVRAVYQGLRGGTRQ